MSRPMFTLTAVVCSRGKTFDAEVSFKEESAGIRGGEFCSDVKYDQRLVLGGCTTREEAKAAAEERCVQIENEMRKAASEVLKMFPEAKP